MQVRLLVVGPTEDRLLTTLIEGYCGRISHYISFEIEVIPNISGGQTRHDLARLKQLEGEQILRRIKPSDEVVLLDEKGKEPTSQELATLLEKKMLSGAKRWTWVVGGPFGFSQEVYNAVPQRLSLSRLTFTHNMIRLLAVEQLYRALTILNNEPYHHN